MLFGSVKVSKVKPQHPVMHIFYWQKSIKALRKHLKTKQNGRSTCILLSLAKDMFLVLAEENIQQHSLSKTDRHDLPRHADPQNKSALASKGCFHAFFFIRNDTYFGGLYDTKIANRIQSLSPVGQCLQFHPSL